MATVTVEVDLDEISHKDLVNEISERCNSKVFVKALFAKKEIRQAIFNDMKMEDLILETSKVLNLSLNQFSELSDFLKTLKS